jgi:hypothetical protein
MAERVGFVPANLAPINDLGLIRSPQSTKSTQSLSIRYKTGTAQSLPTYIERGRTLPPYKPPGVAALNRPTLNRHATQNRGERQSH